jgi:hypothetical protein
MLNRFMKREKSMMLAKKRLGRFALLFASMALLPFALPAASPSDASASKSVGAGSSWTVEKTTQLNSLTIAEGATLAAPKGYSLTMTVDGVETTIRPGTYKGKVVLTDTKDIPMPYMGVKDPYLYRAAVYIKDGVYVPEKSVAAATVGAKITNNYADDLKIISKAEKFNGIVVAGKSTYALINPTIDMTGNGGNDFAGYGAAIMATDKAVLTVNNAHIVTRGAVRTAVWVGGDSIVTVNNSDIDTYSGTLPADYKFSISPAEMKEVPYGLGIAGNQRSTNLIDQGTVFYNNVHVRAHGWGALSSDGNGPTRMYVTNSQIETVDDGYGAFANGDSHDQFRHCTFNVADVALIIGGNGMGTFTDETVVNSKKLGVMEHQGTGGSLLTINKKSKFNTRLAVIEIKGRGGDVIVDDAELHADNGVILQTMDNDDPIMKDMMKSNPNDMPGGGGPGGGGAGGGAPAGAAPGGAPGGGGGAPGGAPAGGLAAGAVAAPGSTTYSGDVDAVFKNVKLTGDLVHAMKGVGEMRVNLVKSTITGAISTAISHPTSGQEPTKETFRTIGDVTNTLAPDTDKNGVKLTIDAKSQWVVSKTSYLNGLTLAEGAVVTAPQGSSVTLLVDGTKTPIHAGTYTGKIELQVAPGA